MKYAGSINVYDDEGNCVYERDLTQDEIIEELLHVREPFESQRIEIQGAPIQISSLEIVTPPAEQPHEEEETVPAPAPVKRPGQKTCKKCGEPGHMAKTCKAEDTPAPVEEPKEEPAPPAAVEKPRQEEKKLTRDQFEMIKDMKRNKSPMSISGELNVSLRQVNSAILSISYEQYEEKFDRYVPL